MATDELVPADNLAAVPALSPEAQEAAVTNMLSEARSWLAHAVEASDPMSIASFRAKMATVAEATKQLNLSKEIQMDAQEMVRRAERGVGLAIRKGQEEGTIYGQNTTHPFQGNQHRGGDLQGASTSDIRSVTEFAARHDLHGGDIDKPGIYRLTDGVSDEEFEEGLAEAKAEGNVSRANVVRKVEGKDSPEAPVRGQKRLDRITELAAKGWTSREIADDLNVSPHHTRTLARDAGIVINADRVIGKSHRAVDHTRIVRETVSALEGLVLGLQMLKIEEVATEEAEHWVTSLNESLRALNRFHKQIKEMTTNAH